MFFQEDDINSITMLLLSADSSKLTKYEFDPKMINEMLIEMCYDKVITTKCLINLVSTLVSNKKFIPVMNCKNYLMSWLIRKKQLSLFFECVKLTKSGAYEVCKKHKYPLECYDFCRLLDVTDDDKTFETIFALYSENFEIENGFIVRAFRDFRETRKLKLMLPMSNTDIRTKKLISILYHYSGKPSEKENIKLLCDYGVDMITEDDYHKYDEIAIRGGVLCGDVLSPQEFKEWIINDKYYICDDDLPIGQGLAISMYEIEFEMFSELFLNLQRKFRDIESFDYHTNLMKQRFDAECPTFDFENIPKIEKEYCEIFFKENYSYWFGKSSFESEKIEGEGPNKFMFEEFKKYQHSNLPYLLKLIIDERLFLSKKIKK